MAANARRTHEQAEGTAIAGRQLQTAEGAVVEAVDGDPHGGTIQIDSVASFGFDVPFTDQDRRILFANNSYFIEKWLRDWLYDNPYSNELRNIDETDLVPIPQPMLSPGTVTFLESNDFPYMNMANLYNSIYPGFFLPPTDTTAIKEFLYFKWWSSWDRDWAWKPENSLSRKWPLEENLAYTNQELKTAGMGGFPIGDLYRWWPEEYAQWKAQERDENARISYWLNTGSDSIFTNVNENSVFANSYALFQNYPNPFNPTTHIMYSVPKTSYISLKVYNLLGQQIITLFEGYRQAGNYKVTFDGSKLASGVYFYRLSAGNSSTGSGHSFFETKKLLLVK